MIRDAYRARAGDGGRGGEYIALPERKYVPDAQVAQEAQVTQFHTHLHDNASCNRCTALS